jgi:prepilin signal peptidase PulO-like enzyme (type II secretory pathway)
MIVQGLLGACFFTAAGYAGAVLGEMFAERLEACADGPAPQRVPLPALLAACALIGAIVTTHSASPVSVILSLIVCVALVAIWITDSRLGLVPDAFTLVPLAIVVLAALWQREWWVLASAVIALVPFAIAAAVSKGRGMGWGDVKLAALGGAVLGGRMAILAFAAACFSAAVLAYARGNRRDPIAFAPYLAAAIGACIPLGSLLPF